MAGLFSRFKKKAFRMEMLVWWTLLGVLVGIALGAGLYNSHPSALTVELLGYPGELFIRALQALVLPLIMLALMSGVFSLRHTTSGVGRITKWSLLYYLLSMMLAVVLGIVMVSVIKPGRDKPFDDSGFTKCATRNGTSPTDTPKAAAGTVDSLLEIGRDLLPTNIVAAAAKPNYLGVMTFAIVFAFATNTFGERAEPLVHLIELCNTILIKIIFVVVMFTPVGVASLIAGTILKACNAVHLLKSLGFYMATVLGGFFIHSTLVLPLTVFLLSRQNPLKVFKSFLPALCMGLGTSSSAATMPVTMQCGGEHGCDQSIVQFVIPLGTNINRDGAALYEAVSAIFICQAHGIHLPVSSLFVIAITATLAAVGSASIPSSALVTMITVLQAVNLPQFIGDVSVLFAVDWLLGMFRTSVNIWGDACACVVVDTWNKRFSRKQRPLEFPDQVAPV
ncbi:hypothetical protein SELMODRAFT_438697 [Selaginella moellendorffii]|uniref:Amino acid transporter n=1 Tax=Selaginella moellendorffii TaxID=88036 RepID=D8QYT3_SELML|nr:excitatory amino acid transporter [Selaginella moellendorffii]XP_024528707.1 excitatory amino acid transporter [Selaginella moellendorffii]EFJ34670.1 hypothetical protein SELMODRAFT_438697 [Selaginella moellendorffii]|eukprot:XP_002964337.1 excitatory amino acid transporter [Selaginella moellendorffii]